MTSCYSEAIYSLPQAEDFHQKAQALLDWLASSERQLRYRGALPEEELPLLKQIEEHKVLTGPRKRTHYKIKCRNLLNMSFSKFAIITDNLYLYTFEEI